MRLAAVLIKNHFLFDEPQILNFGGKFIYDFEIKDFNDNNLILNKKINMNFIEGFFGEKIELLSAIVGQNGSGKTNILYEILNESHFFWINYNKQLNKFNTIFIYEKNNSIILTSKIYYEDHNENYNEHQSSLKFKRPPESKIKCNLNHNIFDEDFDSINIDFAEFKVTEEQAPFFFYFNPLQLNNKGNNNFEISSLADLLDEVIFFSNEELIDNLNEIYSDIAFYKTINLKANQQVFNFKSLEAYINGNYTKKFKTETELFDYIETQASNDGNFFFFDHLHRIYLKQIEDVVHHDYDFKVFITGMKDNHNLFEIYYHLITRLFFYNLFNIEIYNSLCVEFRNDIIVDNLTDKTKFCNLVERIINFIKKSDFKVSVYNLNFYNSILNF